MIAKFNYGDPEPPHTMLLIDRHDDIWFYSDEESAWAAHETAAFAWHDLKRSWFPMREWTP